MIAAASSAQAWCNRVLAIALLAAAAWCAVAARDGPQTQVLVVSSLHGRHRDNAEFSYEHLYRRVRQHAPDIVAVEIRPEDMGRPAEELRRFYPREMIALAEQYGSRTVGVDWLGADIAGKPLPDGYFDSNVILALARALDADAAVADTELIDLQRQKAKLLDAATAASLNDGRYDAVNRRYYARLADVLRGSRYQPVSDFYRARDAHISGNVIEIIRSNPGRRVAVVVGADHRSAVVDALAREFGSRVILAPA